MHRWACLAAAVFLLVAAGAPAREADIAGWGGTWWGMTEPDLEALFAERLRRVDPPLVYDDATVGRFLPEAEFGEQPFRALFQMDEGGRLQQVLLERRDAQATSAAFAAALEELQSRYGEADLVCGTPVRGPDTSPVEREWVWILPTTTIHLSWLDYRAAFSITTRPRTSPIPWCRNSRRGSTAGAACRGGSSCGFTRPPAKI